ncbi:hypothetical protein LCGC14_0376140 [marine sediment metagenome]|uniref:Uncharacterized protein n=1 Tax=marine sediment metagenome TaxID=412755 RepID=A0A0F9VR18_9ZZZZ
MNFNAVRQANGANLTISAIADRIDGTSFIPSGTPKQDCKFTDSKGEQQSVTIWQGNGQPIPEGKVGQTLSINISCKTKGNRTNYGGFWNATAQVAQLSSQPASQGAQNAAGSQKPDWDAIAEGKVRHGLVCAAIESNQLVCKDVSDLDYWKKYVMTGTVPAETVDDIPY